MRKFLYSILIASALCCLTACGGDDEKTTDGNNPADTATAFNTALMQGNYNEALRLSDTDEEDYELMSAWLRMIFEGMTARLDVIGTEMDSTGRGAVVAVKMSDAAESDTLFTQMKKVGEEWKVCMVAG